MESNREFKDFLTSHGQSLESVGLNKYALSRQDALSAISILQKGSVPILGGHVYVREGPKFKHAYANWYCNEKAGEAIDDYLKRSWSIAETYIRNYPVVTGVDPLFAFGVGKSLRSS